MDAVQTDQKSAVYLFLFLLTLILVPITIISILISTALPLTLVAITPGIVGGLMSLMVLMVPRTRTAEGLSVTVAAGVLGWLIGILLYSLIFSQITGFVPLIVVTAIQPAIFIIAITALTQFSSRRRKAEETAVPALIQQAQVVTAEPKAGPAPGTAEIGTAIEKATGAPVSGVQPTSKEVPSKTEPGQEGKRRISELIGTGQPILVLSPQERAIVELMAEFEGALVPAKDIAAETGGRYIAVEKALLYDPVTIYNAISSLLRKGVLENAGFVFKSVSCPKCLKADAFSELVCPHCRSDNISRQDIYQCSNCGYLGPQQSFTRGPFYECPQCRIRSSEVVVTYQTTTTEPRAGAQPVFTIYSSMFRCDSCNSISDVPRTTFLCKSCGEMYDIQTGQIFRFSAVRLNPTYRDAVLREKRPIIMLTNLLRNLGLIIETPYITVDEMGMSRMADLVVKAYGRVVGAVFVIGVPYKSTADVVSEAFWFKIHENLEHVYVLSLSRPSPEVAELVKSLEIELVDLSDAREEELPRRLSAIVDQLRKIAG
jgi:Zn finger protein HypA/HybF involved in hydrogenase expression